MNNLKSVTDAERVAIATAATALGFPPTTFGLVPSWWTDTSSAPPQIELEIWAPTAVALTAAVLHGASLHALTFADITLTSVDHTTGIITKNGHGLKTGDGGIRLVWDTLPPELSATADYWWITLSANTGKIAKSFADAMTGAAIPYSTNGAGVLKLHATADTDRVYWSPLVKLGLAGDGAVALDVQASYRKRVDHSPCVVAYALVGTLDTGSLSAAFVPIQDAGP